MLTTPNPTATPYLPFFVAGPGETDVLLVSVLIILLIVVMLVGVFYFTLHALPERMAHGADRGKLQFIGLLSPIALFTHNNYFWIAALLIAAIRLPDFLSPIRSLARSAKAQTIILGDRAVPESHDTESKTTPVGD